MHQTLRYWPQQAQTGSSASQAAQGHALGDLRPLDQRVYDALRTDILAGRLHPGEPLRIKQLARQLEVSSTPVRNALSRLANEGLVTIYPRRGTHVARITPRHVQEVYAIRLLLEPPVAAQVAADPPDGLVARLRALCDDMATQLGRLRGDWDRAAMPDPAAVASLALDIEFHLAIFEALGNQRLCDLYRFLDIMFTARIPYRQQQPRADAQSTVAEHRAIVEALAARDPDATSHAVTMHLVVARQRLLRRLQGGAGEDEEAEHREAARH